MRSGLLASLFVTLATSAGGCIVVDDSGSHHTGAGSTWYSSGAPVYHIDPGAQTFISPGAQPGYGITANTGNSFRLVDTGAAGSGSGYSEFYGSVYTAGQFSSVVPGCNRGACPLESNDYLSDIITTSDGERIDFDFFTSSGLDGFDFVSSSDIVYFDLYIDGRHYNDLVFYQSAGQPSSVASIPFGLTTQ